MPAATRIAQPCGPLLALALAACAPPPGATSPTAAFPTTDAAMACAQDALADAGFLSQATVEPPVGQRSLATPAETPTSVTRQIVTPLGDGSQEDVVGVAAHRAVGPERDTTVTLHVRAATLVVGGGSTAAEVRPLSALAMRGRDAVVTRCHAAIESGTYPRSS